jgi:copper homeostasis protein
MPLNHTKDIRLEVCVDTTESALAAQRAGAYRVELCANLAEGGTTPSFGTIAAVRRAMTATGLYVLIRPRGGDFLYDDNDFEIMKTDIQTCGDLHCDGVAVGMLTAKGDVDATRCKELIRIAKRYNMGVTFHRAFDRCNNFFEALETIIDMGCERILTSGGRDTALEGVETIQHLTVRANGRISLMPGSGITPENIATLAQKTLACEFHGTFRSLFRSKMTYENGLLNHREKEYALWKADEEKIRKALNSLTK